MKHRDFLCFVKKPRFFWSGKIKRFVHAPKQKKQKQLKKTLGNLIFQTQERTPFEKTLRVSEWCEKLKNMSFIDLMVRILRWYSTVFSPSQPCVHI